ncbi:hypothetical protein [Chloracidobacterium thermophilum]|uniref:hypothetical protein n=1 Tax=Chloracidobacterium thermophilum TaxID=458033 RepID=UPI000738737F|nr:hypothetical protein [Chloracidobacterium thermophilum]
MARTTIDRLIINSPYEEPARHWRYDRETRLFDLVEGRCPAGYVVASGDPRAFDDDEDLIEAYRGTVSLPFEPGEHKRIAVKIVDDRGIESLKVVELAV